MTETELYEKLGKVKLVAMDVDGTYTSGVLMYDSHGEIIKGFHSHDGLALELLRLAGIKRGFITGRSDNATRARGEYLDVDFHLDNISDKSTALTKLFAKYNITDDESLYIGDDLNDLAAFETAGICIAVANAVPEIKLLADYVTKAPGGSGAIREVVAMILRARNIDPVELWKTGTGKVGNSRRKPLR